MRIIRTYIGKKKKPPDSSCQITKRSLSLLDMALRSHSKTTWFHSNRKDRKASASLIINISSKYY